MKNLLAVLASMLTVGLVISGCGTTGPAAPGPVRTQPEPADAPPVAAVFVSVNRGATDDALMDQMRGAEEEAIAELLMAGQPVTEYHHLALRMIEEARFLLRDIEYERVATQAIADEITMCGQPVPAYLRAALWDLEESRLAVLRRIGMAE